MTDFNFSSHYAAPTATSPGWSLDPFLSLEGLGGHFSFPSTPSAVPPYLNEAEESRLLAALTSPHEPIACISFTHAERAAMHNAATHKANTTTTHENALTAAMLLKLEQEADPFASSALDFRAPPLGSSYDTVPTPPHASPSERCGPTPLDDANFDAMSDATLEDENLNAQAVPHSPDLPFDELYYNCSESTPNSGASTPTTATRRRAAPFSKTKRRYPRSHTCREPERSEFLTEEDFQSAWTTWRQIRNCNNEAVRRSRNSKKALLSCKSESCAAMAKKLKAAEKIKELLLKAACAPHSLSRTESMAYNKLIASRVEYVSLSTGTDMSQAEHNVFISPLLSE